MMPKEKTFIVTPVLRGGTFEMKGKNIDVVKRRLATCGRKFVVEQVPDYFEAKF